MMEQKSYRKETGISKYAKAFTDELWPMQWYMVTFFIIIRRFERGNFILGGLIEGTVTAKVLSSQNRRKKPGVPRKNIVRSG
jgi:hypothetical protein